MTTEELKEAANALLATKKKVMTGREIEACEWTRSDEFEDDFYFMEYGYVEWQENPMASFIETAVEPDGDDEEEADEEEAAIQHADFMEDLYGSTCFRVQLIKSLHIQFYCEITNWINKRNSAMARKVVRA